VGYAIRLMAIAILQSVSVINFGVCAVAHTSCSAFLRQLHLPAGVPVRHAPDGGQVERHPNELYPRVDFLVTNLAHPAGEDVVPYAKTAAGVAS
jgi:hypothetical protein